MEHLFCCISNKWFIEDFFAGNDKYTVDDLGIKSGVFRILKDRFQDIVWIATDGQGVYIYSEGKYSISSVTYQDLNQSIGKPVRSIFGIMKVHYG